MDGNQKIKSAPAQQPNIADKAPATPTKKVTWKGRFKVSLPATFQKKLRKLLPNPFKSSSGQRSLKQVIVDTFRSLFHRGSWNVPQSKPESPATVSESRKLTLPELNARVEVQVAASLTCLAEGKTDEFINGLFSVRKLMNDRAFQTGEGHAEEDFRKNIAIEIEKHSPDKTAPLTALFGEEASHLNRLRDSVDEANLHFRNQDPIASNHVLTLSSARAFLIVLSGIVLGKEKASEWQHQLATKDPKLVSEIKTIVSQIPPGRIV